MKNQILKTFGFTFLSLTILSCSNNDDSIDDRTTDLNLKEVVANNSNNVIISTYNTLNQKAQLLKNAIDLLANDKTDANLKAAKYAWSQARIHWEQSEGFLYGPVDSEGIDPAMDTWPVDVAAMNNILNSNVNITVQTLENNNEARGFHLIEFLLWGENGQKTVGQITNRQIELLKAATQDLKNNTQKLYDGWISSGGNFVNNFLNPSEQAYPSYISVLEEMTEGMITIADEVGNGKIEDPLNSEGSTPNPQLEESRFSNNSKADFADNIRSIQNMYLGTYNGGGNGKGITVLVSSKNNTLDAKIKNAINASILAIESIPNTFTEAIYNNRPEVKNAQQKVNELHNILKAELKPFILNNLQ